VTLTEPTTQARWPCAPLGSQIECAPRVLHTVCLEAALGLRKLAKGGLEVGGVLFGARAEGLIRVLAVRPIECEHRFGPSFVLSDTDEAKLQEILKDFRTDGELASLAILGCYFSHSRHGAALTDRDLELCNRYFSEKDLIAVTLIPSATGGVRGTILARDAQGTFAACHEFEYSVLNKAPSETVRTPPPKNDRKPLAPVKVAAISRQIGVQTKLQPAGPVVIAAQHVEEPEPRQPVGKVSTARPPETPHGALKTRSSLLVGFLILIACWPNRSIPVTQIPLRLTDSDHKLLIHWDAEHPAVREAALGSLDILDGDQEPQHVSIAKDLLRRGWMEYKRKSELVRISFSLVGRGVTISESAIYFAPQHPDAIPVPREASAVKLEVKFQDSIAPPVRQTLEPIGPENATSVLRNGDRKKLPRLFHAPLEMVARSGGPANTKPAILPDAPVLHLDSGTASLPLQLAPTMSLPAPHLATIPSASGRLIWTGHLPKRSVLSLSAQGASFGYLNGWLPRNDVHVEVRPAELMEGGMVIFTKDQNLRPESPSLSNGWNTVLYKLDVARASELEILDAPGPTNDWSHLMLRDGIRSLSVIVVDWRAAKN
jgi:hypothetical protein